MNYQSYHLLAMILKFLLHNRFKLIRRLASEIEIMFLLEFVVFLEVWFKTCISTGIKFHETVQVCCDNFPKEKIREVATMLARLSGGIVVNIHNVKTIIMFRGRNYR
ncbi:hypothetical protein Cni_G06861 [Canna indica]|uniref:CRM domain-containing protein n=1 Tax=Canna indica TaxID=4628 RepID=A0AAQ3JY40_9LILI|nr:hypothetical protein Cni_G06861 [Canna indica]